MVNSAVYDGEFDRDNVTKRGRPSIDRAEKKHRRNVTVSDEAWQALQDRIIKTLGIRSVSELNEKIGLEKLKVLDVENPSIKFADVPIYPRLKSLLEPPSAVFFSLLRFFLRVARELQLDTKERLIFDVVNKSAAIIFYIVYIHPDIYISNPSALMRWLGWRFLWIQYYKNLSSNQAKVSQKKTIGAT